MASDMNVRLFPDSPEFPAEFLDLIQSGQMVFFCGAGLSVGTGLPLFSGLVRKLDWILNPNSIDRFEKKRNDYDRMLSELESRFVPGRMREQVRRILSKPPFPPESATLENHRNILKLAAIAGGGIRLVTTNFDNRFSLAAKSQRIPIIHDDAPKLPVPESPGWSSLVHLHGRIHKNGNLNDLVLNASDFGQAYLSEGWARRFIVRLMRRWSVIFVGYRLDDPPMRYLMDAVYDPRGGSEGFKKAYALVGCMAGEHDRQLPEWESKHVTPIFYDNSDNHAILRRVLRELALLKHGRENYRAKLALREIKEDPGEVNGEKAKRVVWALRNHAAAQIFAQNNIFTNAKDEDKFVSWLKVFHVNGLFQIDLKSINAIAYPPEIKHASISSAIHLTWWMAQHVHYPSFLRWLAEMNHNRLLSPYFIRQLAAHINQKNNKKKISRELSELWDIFVQEHAVPFAHQTFFDRSVYFKIGKASNWANSNLAQQIIAALRPRPLIIPGVGYSFPYSNKIEKYGVRVIINGGIDYPTLLRIKRTAIPLEHMEALSIHLETVASLMQRCGINTEDLWRFETGKDIDPFDQNNYYWVFFARLIRNMILGMIEGEEISRLKRLVMRWKESRHPLLHRLALFAITEAARLPQSTPRLPADWGAEILVEHPSVLWESEFAPETCRFLTTVGTAITSSTLTKLERVICKGPPRRVRYAMTKQIQIAIRLTNLGNSGVKLPLKCKNILKAAHSENDGMDFQNVIESFRPGILIQQGAFLDSSKKSELAELTAEECANYIRRSEHPNIRALIETHPDEAIAAFEKLAEQRFWGHFQWSSFLNGFYSKKDIPNNLVQRLLHMLDKMPEETALHCAQQFALLLWKISETRPFSEFESAWHRAWNFNLKYEPITSKHIMSGIITNVYDILTRAAWDCFARDIKNKKMWDLFANILASEKKPHDYGKLILVRWTSQLFDQHPKWAKQHLLPFFGSEHHLSFEMWVSFLKGRKELSEKFILAIKPGLLYWIKHADKFEGEIAQQFSAIFVFGCLNFPNAISRGWQKRTVGNMSHKTRMILCEYLQSDRLSAHDFGKRGDVWRKSLGPFLAEVWPECKPPDGQNSLELAKLVIKTGDAFPEAVTWAHDFLQPIAEGGYIHPIHQIQDDYGESIRNILAKFPEECLIFLHRIVPDTGIVFDIMEALNFLLDKLKAAKPSLAKRQEFIRLQKIAYGG